MDILMVVLRLIHVLSGVFWAGSTFVFVSHITPTVKATGAEGQKFMQHLTGKANISNALAIAGGLAMLSGLAMYANQGWDSRLNTVQGIALTLGAALGIGVFFHGYFVQRRTIMKMQDLGKSIAAAGGPPSPEQAAQIGALAAKVERNGILLAYLLGATVVLMGVFQYL